MAGQKESKKNVTGDSPDKLSIVVYAGFFDKVHYALVMASASAAMGRPVTLFFTMGACRAINSTGADGEPAWKHMPLSEVKKGGTNAETASQLDEEFANRNVATFEELLEACVMLGVKFMVCEMGLIAVGMKDAPLRDDITIEEGGVVTFLDDASKDGAIIFI